MILQFPTMCSYNMRTYSSSIGLNVQQEIDNVIRETDSVVSRETVVDIVRTLLDDCSHDPIFDTEFSIEMAVTLFPNAYEDDIEVSVEVVNRVLNRHGTTQPKGTI